jgi:hypothetical protein
MDWKASFLWFSTKFFKHKNESFLHAGSKQTRCYSCTWKTIDCRLIITVHWTVDRFYCKDITNKRWLSYFNVRKLQYISTLIHSSNYLTTSLARCCTSRKVERWFNVFTTMVRIYYWYIPSSTLTLTPRSFFKS